MKKNTPLLIGAALIAAASLAFAQAPTSAALTTAAGPFSSAQENSAVILAVPHRNEACNDCLDVLVTVRLRPGPGRFSFEVSDAAGTPLVPTGQQVQTEVLTTVHRPGASTGPHTMSPGLTDQLVIGTMLGDFAMVAGESAVTGAMYGHLAGLAAAGIPAAPSGATQRILVHFCVSVPGCSEPCRYSFEVEVSYKVSGPRMRASSAVAKP